MHGSSMSGWLLMALSAATGAYCLLRMRSTSQQARTAAGGEAVMGFGMAAMALPAAMGTLPGWGWTVLAAVFAAGGLRALWQLRSSAHHLHHLVGSLAMVYMALTMTAGMASGGAHGGAMDDGAMSGGSMEHASHSAGGIPLLTGALLAYYAVYVLRTGATLVPAVSVATGGGGPAGAIGWGARPELALACRLAMGMAMFAMLLTI
ncbi:DUF5134 domain-containing protein [Streptomyces sp. NPDC090052]|uniref:DUF5134 domain-containing protein n=1 Tax=unclassified Streptomyces TaxID=2593676 RepID=UPI00224F7642|nr:DUF5134 domain-containing protein [Streptomyces sp. NBC_01306]MCX4728205.1 DUF5134 domain-containing protein [Streptomyces sp. NBC_01306]WSX71390.1 DUF5134 domain-containing protein [Streptomyces sp. NBC_00932]